MNIIQNTINEVTTYCISHAQVYDLADQKRINALVTNRVLKEVENWIAEQLPADESVTFKTSIHQALTTGNTVEYISMLTHYFVNIPNSTFLLEGRMNGLKVQLAKAFKQ